MHLPHRRVQQRYIFEEHILATIGLNELWPQIVTFAENTLAHGNAAFRHMEKLTAVLLLVHVSQLPPAVGAALPCSPMLAIAIAVNRSLAGDGNVLLLERIDEGRVVH